MVVGPCLKKGGQQGLAPKIVLRPSHVGPHTQIFLQKFGKGERQQQERIINRKGDEGLKHSKKSNITEINLPVI